MIVFSLLAVLVVENCSGITLVSACAHIDILSTGHCRIEYQEQPPSKNKCNPFHDDNSIAIVLQYAAKRQSGVTDQFEFRWFRRYSSRA